MLSLLHITERSEKDRLQNYLVTLHSVCEANFEELKEKFDTFFEALNLYSPEQIELYESKLYKVS